MATEFVDKQWRIPNSWNVDESNQGKISNYSMKFSNASTDFIEFPETDFLKSGQASFSFWSNPNTYGGNNYGYFFSGSLQTDGGLAMSEGGTGGGTYTPGVLYWYNGSASIILNVTLTENVWNHVVIVFDGTTITTYKDGSNPVTTTITAPAALKFNTIGKYSPANSNILNGELDQVCVFDYALSESQVSTLYGNSSAGYFQIGNPMALTPNPVVFYPLGDKDVQQTVDSTDWRILNNSLQDYVFDFNPSDGDYINFANGSTMARGQEITYSVWANLVNFSGDIIGNKGSSNFGTGLNFSAGDLIFQLGDGSNDSWNNSRITLSNYVNTGEWFHIIGAFDGTNAKIYINGIERNNWTPTQPFTISGWNNNFQIGKRADQGSSFINGRLSNVAFWNSGLTPAQVTTIYNNGSPVDISSLNPVSWWKLNAQDTFDGNDWTIKDYAGSNDGTSFNMTSANLVQSNLQYTSGYSPWAIDLNGTDQLFNCSNDSSLQITGAITVSYWFKGQGGSATAGGVGKLGNNGSRGFLLGMTSSGTITFYIAPTASSLISAGYSHTPDTNWHHIVGVFNPSTSLELYFDGQSVDTTPTSTSSQYNAVNNLQIGARGDSTGFFDGQLSNVAIWNTNLSSSQISTMYNNGIPGDISSLNPLAWWELGVMTGFNSSTGIWTAISNTKTNYAAVSEANMTEDDLVNGPGYSTNATGTSTLVLEKQAPYSFNNALSENMAISNRDDSQASDPYPLIFELDLTGETSSYDFITPRMQTSVTYPFTVDWGDGNVETITNSTFFLSSPNVGRLSHTYDTDTYPRPVIQIGKSTDVGQVVFFRVDNGGSKFQLFDLKQFGQANFTSFNLYSESPGINILVTASDNLKFEGTSFDKLLDHTVNANPSTINSWDISTVNNANRLFYKARAFNQDLNNWDTSSTRPGQSEAGIVNLTSLTFTTNTVFNGDITNWFTTRSTSINQMFSQCSVFNRDISTKYISAANSPTGSAYVAWDTQNVTNFATAFYQARAFNQDISNWNTSKVTNMSTMFSGAFAFNQDISTKQVTVNGVTYTAWDVSKVTNMFGMLTSCIAFNNTLDNWELNANLSNMAQFFISNNSISDDNFSDNWAIFANSVKDDNSASGGAAPNFPSGVNATAQNNPAKIKVNRSAPTSSGGVQHFTTISRALSYLTSDVEIVEIEEEYEDAIQLYTADFLDTATSSYPTKLVGVTVPDFTFEWSGSVWEFKKSGATIDTDTGGATLQEGPENGTWNILTVVIANANWNFVNTGTVYTT